MADLPEERCMEAAPFTYSGVDMFGPILMRKVRSDLKHYAVSLHVSPVVLFISNLPMQSMPIHSLWHCADSWQEEFKFDRYGQTTEQTLLVLIMNYRKH